MKLFKFKIPVQTQNRYLYFLSFQGVNSLFVLSFEECSRKSQAIFPSNQGEKKLCYDGWKNFF